MLFAMRILAVLLVALNMTMSVAHALELPGKLRLRKEFYLAVQTIYYPGFTMGGVVEPLSGVALLALFFLERQAGMDSWLLMVAFAAVVVAHLIFWIVTQPVNRYWLNNFQLHGLAETFFKSGAVQGSQMAAKDGRDWKEMRNRWEASHLMRALLTVIAFIAVSAAVVCTLG